MGKHNEFGKLGEQLASNFLVNKGYTILQHNYRYLKAEIDILAKKQGVLVVVEVKSRSTDFEEHIAEAVNAKKRQLLVGAADAYVIAHDLDVDVRFDIITILKKDGHYLVEHLEDAFYYF